MMASHTRRLTKLFHNVPETDHRAIGLKQKLFFFNDLSKGSCFFLPRGAHIYNKLIQYLRKEYRKRNYEEVISPNIYDCRLWKTSGHWDHYKDDMIKFQVRDKDFSLKPMNCPGHCLMFKLQETKTNEELPVRWADFGVLHRNELSGSLTGLARVRRFQQDDAHIFCAPDQVESEISDCLQFTKEVYDKFGFTFDVNLSTRPEVYMGQAHMWDKAEEALKCALDRSNFPWTEQSHEGAFYGPKIDLVVGDRLGRKHQCATIQLDFQLPERFDLTYKDLSTRSTCRPVIIHRAILGSLERFLAMITENCQGRWPFWLSPLQAQVIPVHSNLNSHAKRLSERLRQEGFWVDCDLRADSLNSKVRDALLIHYNLILIIGEKEIQNDRVTCRFLLEDELQSVDGKEETELKNKEDCRHAMEPRRKRVRNINMPTEELIEFLKDLERRQVSRADIELLHLKASLS